MCSVLDQEELVQSNILYTYTFPDPVAPDPHIKMWPDSRKGTFKHTSKIWKEQKPGMGSRTRARARNEVTKSSKEQQNFTQRAPLSEHAPSRLLFGSFARLLSKIVLKTCKERSMSNQSGSKWPSQESRIETHNKNTMKRQKFSFFRVRALLLHFLCSGSERAETKNWKHSVFSESEHCSYIFSALALKEQLQKIKKNSFLESQSTALIFSLLWLCSQRKFVRATCWCERWSESKNAKSKEQEQLSLLAVLPIPGKNTCCSNRQE